MRPLPLAALVAALFALHAPPAGAQADTTLPEVRVSDAAAPLPERPTVESERRRLERVPGGTNLALPQNETRLGTLRDALDFQPGVVIQDFFGGIDQPRLNIRGSGIQSNPLNRGFLLLEDGLPVSEADGSFVIGLVDLRNTGFVSVRRGANAITPGATTLGGEVDFRSLTAADERGRVAGEYGSFGRQGFQAAIGGVGERLDGRINLSDDRNDGYRRHSNGTRTGLRANAGFRGEGTFENRTFLSYTDLDFKIPTVVPKDRVESDPRGVLGDRNTPIDNLLNVNRRDPRRETEQWRLANQSRWSGLGLAHQLGLYGQYTDDLFNDQTTTTVTDTDTLGAQWQAGTRTGPVDWRIALAWATSDMHRELYATNPQTGGTLQRFGDFDLEAENRDALAGASWDVGSGWALVGEVKASSVTRDTRNRGAGPSLDQDWSYASPRIGAIWSPAPGRRLYANLSRSNEAPTFWEIVAPGVPPANPAAATVRVERLDVQRADTFEIGGDLRYGTGRAAGFATLTFYRSEVEKELLSTTDAFGVRVGTFNYPADTRHQGVEAGAAGTVPLGDALAVEYRAAWTYSDFRFRGGEFGTNRIAGVPRHVISAEALLRFGAWRFGPNLRWLPDDTPTDHANTLFQDAYAIWGLKLDFRPDAHWSAFVQLDNATDERYASAFAIRNRASPNDPTFLPGVGRSVTGGVRYVF